MFRIRSARFSLLMALFLVGTAMHAINAAQRGSAPVRPNILFILADDLGAESSELYPDLYDSSAPSGHGQVATPNIRALAKRGLVFDNVWVTPLCSSTRAAMLMGLYGHNTGVTRVNESLPGKHDLDFRVADGFPDLASIQHGGLRQVAPRWRRRQNRSRRQKRFAIRNETFKLLYNGDA